LEVSNKMERGLQPDQISKLSFQPFSSIKPLKDQTLYHHTNTNDLFELQYPSVPRGPVWFVINSRVPPNLEKRGNLDRTLSYKYHSGAHPNLYVFHPQEKDKILREVERNIRQKNAKYSFKDQPEYLSGRLSILDRFGPPQEFPSSAILSYFLERGYDGIYEPLNPNVNQVVLFEPSRWLTYQTVDDQSRVNHKQKKKCYTLISEVINSMIKDLDYNTTVDIKWISKQIKKKHPTFITDLMACGIEEPINYIIAEINLARHH